MNTDLVDDLEAFIDEALPALDLSGQTRVTLVWLLAELLEPHGYLETLSGQDRCAVLGAVADRLLTRHAEARETGQ